jgi:hypothetical protein
MRYTMPYKKIVDKLWRDSNGKKWLTDGQSAWKNDQIIIVVSLHLLAHKKFSRGISMQLYRAEEADLSIPRGPP